MMANLGVTKKIKDLVYSDYDSLVAVGIKEAQHALGSDNKALIDEINNINAAAAYQYQSADADFGVGMNTIQSLWFTKRGLLKFLLDAGYVTEREIFVDCL